MIGRNVLVRFVESDGSNEQSKEAKGEVVDKVMVSVIHNDHIISNDNYLIRKEDGTCLLLHPTCILKID